MPPLEEIFAEADRALATVPETQGRDQLLQMRRFMEAFERLGREVAKGSATWTDARPWALGAAERLMAAPIQDALAVWETEMAGTFYKGGEEEGERALSWRSQHALALALMHGTPAADLLASHDDAEVDEEFKQEAERIALDAPEWVPRSHTWWRWTEWRLEMPIVAEVEL